MTATRIMPGRWSGLAAMALAAGLLAGAASAQTAGTGGDNSAASMKPSAGLNGRIEGAGSGSATTAPGNNVVDPSQGNGVAGTGLGKASNTGAGTGSSVSGQAGGGIVTNSTDVRKTP